MLELEVKSGEVVTKEGVSKRSGKAYKFRLQNGWLHGVDGYPSKVEFNLRDAQEPLAPGLYVVGPECFTVDRNLHPQIVLNRAQPSK